MTEQCEKIGLEAEHLNYTLPRWDPKTWSIMVMKEGRPHAIPVAAYWGYSGKTGPQGVGGELLYGGLVGPGGT